MTASHPEEGATPVLASLLASLLRAPLSRAEVEAAAGAIGRATPEAAADAIDAVIASGADLEALKPAVSKFLNLLGSALLRGAFEPDDPFLASLAAENGAALALLDALRAPLARLNAAAAEGSRDGALFEAGAIAAALPALAPLDLHYAKKENILFPRFEAAHPRWRCIRLMWALHDDVRAGLRALPALLASRPETRLAELNAALGRLFFDVHALVFREERILFPLVAAVLSLAERRALYRESKASGFAFLGEAEVGALEARFGVAGEAAEEGRRGPAAAGPGAGAPARVPLGAGGLPAEVLGRVFSALPLDLTFVGADDRVEWFSDGGRRIFPRSPSVIGRDVRNCHPAASVDRVMAIVDSFRRGERDEEDFWLEYRGRFVHIRYLAIRGEGGYLGTLEVSQDITDLRALEGEKRLASGPGGGPPPHPGTEKELP